MERKGKYFDVVLKKAHLNWGTEGSSRKRNQYEAYIPISMKNAVEFDIKPGEVFECFSKDGFFNGPLKATGTQGGDKKYGKNFYKERDMRALGYYLKDRKEAKEGDIIRLEFTSETAIIITLLDK